MAWDKVFLTLKHTCTKHLTECPPWVRRFKHTAPTQLFFFSPEKEDVPISTSDRKSCSLTVSVRVCRLNTRLVWKGIERSFGAVRGAKLGGFETSDDILQGGGHHKVLLLQPQLLPFEKLQARERQSESGSHCGVAKICQGSPAQRTSRRKLIEHLAEEDRLKAKHQTLLFPEF